MSTPSLVWLRDDLRIADNPALRAAVDRDEPVAVLYLLDEESPRIRPLGGAAKWWLHHSLASLDADLRERGARLLLRRGRAADVVPAIASALGAGAVFWNRRYGLAEREVDAGLKTALRESGVQVESFAASLLFEPWTVQTGAGTHYGVYSPFWRACLGRPDPRRPVAEPTQIRGETRIDGDDLDDWGLLPTRPDWAGGLRERWTPGESAAHDRLREFLRDDLPDYATRRDMLGDEVTSRLSPRLRWGELSPYQIWHATPTSSREAKSDPLARAASRFLSQIGWREFAWHTLYHFPDLANRNLHEQFDAFEWRDAARGSGRSDLLAWRHGMTGYPVVDAGMSELWNTGVMHNRVRMITASFLTKNLRLDWRLGEQWFWDTLVDADDANNSFGWQWVAGSGADAAPYFRVFNPELQASKFDPDGAYVRRWAPQFAEGTAPEPIVDLAESRRAALDSYDEVKAATGR